ncbi:hypothetical protein CBW42_00865 [Butyricicoccus porcorum]|uniref:Uncharacterized protein n=1 Tax=Butyricicoccus porcorum TaxID=1945634 RepID=A0A252F7P7_9FIRM|nr:hypothetical protein CBW42_00865 [Butyricicoccus porcorum]
MSTIFKQIAKSACARAKSIESTNMTAEPADRQAHGLHPLFSCPFDIPAENTGNRKELCFFAVRHSGFVLY